MTYKSYLRISGAGRRKACPYVGIHTPTLRLKLLLRRGA